jgi:hypothetical protein
LAQSCRKTKALQLSEDAAPEFHRTQPLLCEQSEPQSPQSFIGERATKPVIGGRLKLFG